MKQLSAAVLVTLGAACEPAAVAASLADLYPAFLPRKGDLGLLTIVLKTIKHSRESQ